jgi:hypothetical protein
MRSDVDMDDQQIARLNAEIERLREQKCRWMRLADERAIEVGTLKLEVERLQKEMDRLRAKV